MKKLVVFLFVVTAFGACKKKDPEPKDPAQAVAGSYALSSFTFLEGTDGIDLPKLPVKNNGQTLSGKVELSPTSLGMVTMTLSLELTGEKPESFDVEDIEVKEKSGGYGLYIDDELVADADGQNIIFNYSETDPQTKEVSIFKFVGKK